MFERPRRHRPVTQFPSVLSKYGINFCYLPNDYNYSNPFLAEAIEFPELADKLNSFLQLLPQDTNSPIPIKKNILCKDLINPHTIPALHIEFDHETNEWTFPAKVPIYLYTRTNLDLSPNQILNSGNYTLIQNNVFLLAIRELPEEIELYIYKK